MSSPTDELLNERGKTHGDYSRHAEITQSLKDYMRSCPNWNSLTPSQKETLDMNAHKVGRILAGNPNFADHWDDIAGYARLVSKEIEQRKLGTTPKQAA
jgi:hypothetical protein